MNEPSRVSMVNFAASILRGASDWQEAQDALSNHEVFGPYLNSLDDSLNEAQSIIREAEMALGDKLNY